jgi:NADH:ubiquinone oxidoreductase subunit 6 (subunit J)
MDDFLLVYYIVTVCVLLVTGIMVLQDEGPKEIENIWDWIIYGLLWFVLFIKALFKYIFMIWKK